MRARGFLASLTSRGSHRKAIRCVASLLALCTLCHTSRAAPLPTNQQLLKWGEDVYNNTVSSLQIKNSSLFAEFGLPDGNRGGGDSGFSYLWPASTQFRVEDALARLDPVTYGPVVRSFSDQLYSSYWSPTGGYRSGVSSGATRFYDDNAHMVVSLAQGYQATGDATLLNRAKSAYAFVLSGEDNAGGGGIYFSESDHSSKDTLSTLEGVRAALLLYQVTRQPQYLTDATRLYAWAAKTTQQYNGLFMERLYLTGTKAGTIGDYTLINGAGIGLSDNLLFYDLTGKSSYLAEAKLIGSSSIPRYFDSSSGAINDEGYWDFELVNALDDLYLHDHNTAWLADVDKALQWLHDNRADANGHYGTLWGRGGQQTTPLSSWYLNDQAPVAESYLYTAAVPEPFAAPLMMGTGAITLLRRRHGRAVRKNP